MNRKSKRIVQRKAKAQSKQKFTLLDLQKALSIALEMRKESKGHLFKSHLKERCVFCGEDRKTKKDCEWWFMTFLDRLQTILINPQFFVGNDLEANYLQHGDEYKDIKVLSKETINGK